jgi:CYTH domain-containing protein
VSEPDFGDFEFERKFYVSEMPAITALDPRPELIVQAYLFAADGYAVRVRLQGPAPAELNVSPGDLIRAMGLAHTDAIGTMTAKGPAAGGTRYEAERHLDPMVAGQIISRAEHVVIKVRYSAWLGQDGWIVDRFLGRNAPLLLAEVERNAPVVDLMIPAFCLTEVSEDDRFRNEHLAHQPFGEWADSYRAELQKVGPRFVDTLGRNEVEGTQRRP